MDRLDGPSSGLFKSQAGKDGWSDQQDQRPLRTEHGGADAGHGPGGGTYSTLAIVSRIGSIERFASPRSLANYFGLTPGCRNSGEATDRLGSITKEGSSMVRFITGQMVLHVLKKDPWMRQWYRRIRRRRGSKIARVAVMRRLVTIFWHILTHNDGYQIGGPPRLRLKQALRTREMKSI